jgi:hypothetical protein
MSKQYFSTVGSGTVPHIGYGPAHNFPQGAYPGAHSKNELRTREGDGVILLNPEDFSISIGLRTSSVTVTTSAVALPINALENRRALVIHNNGTSVVYLGASNVTTANGLPLAVNEKIAFDIQNNPNVVVYAVATSSVDVRIMELA